MTIKPPNGPASSEKAASSTPLDEWEGELARLAAGEEEAGQSDGRGNEQDGLTRSSYSAARCRWR